MTERNSKIVPKTEDGRYMVVFMTEAATVKELSQNLTEIGLIKTGIAVGNEANAGRVVAWKGPDITGPFDFETAAENLRRAARRLERRVKPVRLPTRWAKEWLK